MRSNSSIYLMGLMRLQNNISSVSKMVDTRTVLIPPRPSERCSNPVLLFPAYFLTELSTPRMHFLMSWLKKCTHSFHYCSFLHFIKKPDRPFHNNLLAQHQFLLITIINLSVFPSSEVWSEMKGKKCREKNGERGSLGEQDPVRWSESGGWRGW